MEELWLLERMRQWHDVPAIIWQDTPVTYLQLLERTQASGNLLTLAGVKAGSVVALEGSFCPTTCAVLLALINKRAIIVPLTSAMGSHRETFLEIAQVQFVIRTDGSAGWDITPRPAKVSHPLVERLQQRGAPGLVLFSSGSTGQNKAALHDLAHLLEKFKTPRHAARTLAFLLFDHIGGLNTLFHTLSNGGTVVPVQNRDPASVCQAIEKYKVELLPTSPTFLNMLLISEAYRRYDLTSLRMITYGTEVMPESTLTRLHQLFPQVRLLQTYGLTELGILRSQSKGPDSLWVKIKGEGFETKINNGTLWVHARSAMMGYLNAPSPFDSEGWMDTGDAVEVDGDYMRILGRKSDIINVGGEKVYPAQVESVLMQMDNVREIVVFGEKNALLGNIVVAQITPAEPESSADLKQRLEVFASDRLAAYQIPQKIIVSDAVAHSPRFKKIRSQPVAA